MNPQTHRRRLAAILALLTAIAAGVLLWVLYDGFLRYHWKYRYTVPLSLAAYANNDGLAWDGNPGDGNFDTSELLTVQPGSSFPAEAMRRTGELLAVSSTDPFRFLLLPDRDGALNNVACQGQPLSVPPGEYATMALVLASHASAQDEFFGIQYESGYRQVQVRVPGWLESSGGGLLGAASSSYYWTRGGGSGQVNRVLRPATLWIAEVRLDPTRILMGLVLPASPRTHVFAVSLRPVRPGRSHREHCDQVLREYRSLWRQRPPDRWGLWQQAHRVRQHVTAIQAEAATRWPRETDWLVTGCSYLERRVQLRAFDPLFTNENSLRNSLLEMEDDIRRLQQGENPFAGKRGNSLRSYRSAIDGSLQPYSLSVPWDYSEDKAYPLIILLHGHGWYSPFQGHPTLEGDGVFYLAPHGRGSMDYMFIAEEDLLCVLDEVCRDYRIDPDRIAVSGGSMGGTGSWNYGVKFPHRFAGIAPTAGNATRKAWETLWDWGKTFPPGPLERLPDPFRGLCTFVADSLDPLTFAENLVHLPVFCLHGAKDEVVPPEHARAMVARLRETGCPVIYREHAETGHGGFPQPWLDEQWNWLHGQKRVPSPGRIHHKTARLKYGRSYWVTMTQFAEPARFATVDAEAKADDLEVRTDNISVLEFDWGTSPFAPRAGPASLRIDGSTVANPGASVFVRDADGRWSPGSHPAGLRKKPWLEGPVQDAFTTPFILVYGTPEDEISRYIIEAEARRFTEDWELLYNAPCRIKSDRDVTEQELADYSLVLYGNKDQNLVYRRMADQLPLQVDSQGVQIGSERWDGADVGAKFCFPSPLNPDRYVCIFAGATWRGTYGINNRFGNWFHWGPFDNYNWFDFVVFDERTVSPPTVLCTGFFDSQWRMSTRWRYDGNEELRGSVAPRNVPVHLRAPGGGRLYLSDLVPASIRQHKGNVNSDRSFRGNPIRLGGARYDRGLGVRAPSNVEYEIGGRFRRFRAVIGIDLEGGTGTDARLKNEYVQFMVWGDGRRLFASPWLQWNMPPVRIQVPVVGVERLRLEVQSGSARWHLGSAAWADACVE